MKHFRQLSPTERYQIDALNEIGWRQADIARRLNRHASTISRELKRNRIHHLYRGGTAQKISDTRRRTAHKAMFTDKPFINHVRRKLWQQWSPEQIVGSMRHCPVSHEWIYRYIRRDKAHGGTLFQHLRQARNPLRKRYGSNKVQSTIPNRIDISQRPACVDNRSRLGDWEGDTVIGSDLKSILVTLVERKSGLLRCAKLNRRHSRKVAQTIVRLLRPFKKHVHTITFDNGTEFGRHQHIARALDADIFFAKPYSSWQRGSNENTNGLLRQYFPKKTNFKNLSTYEIQKATQKINNRPRKRHNFKSPLEMFNHFKNNPSNCCSY